MNGKLVPLRTQLKNGDIVEIVTSPTQTPSREWLNMVATSRAKHKIRHWLNTEQKHRSIELGRKLIEREAKRYKVQWRKLIAENALDGVLTEHGLPRIDDLYADVGYGKIAARSIVERCRSRGHLCPSFETSDRTARGDQADRQHDRAGGRRMVLYVR